MKLKELVKKIRSKNAGPFLLTIDIFCSNKKKFETVIQKITKIEISKLYKIPKKQIEICLLYTSPSPRDRQKSRMPSSA